MKLELEGADEVVGAQVLSLLGIVVRVVHLHLVLLRLLEVEVHKDLLDELRVEIVVDDLGLTNLLPQGSSLLEEDHEGV